MVSPAGLLRGDAEHADLARVGVETAGDTRQQGRPPDTVWPHQERYLAVRHLEGDPVEHVAVTEPI
jgi:hypothetical protein